MPSSHISRTANDPLGIEVGAIVAYTKAFLSRHNHYSSDMPTAQGRITALHQLDNGTILADIQWNKPGLPKRVNLKHLTFLNPAPISQGAPPDDRQPA
jgi:hypothetical protein